MDTPAVAVPIVAPPLKPVSLEGKPFEGAYGLVFGSLVSGNMELATFQPYAQNTFMYTDPYSDDRAFVNYGFPNRRMNSKGFGLGVGYNILINDNFLFGLEARASLPRWSYINGREWGYDMQYPQWLQRGTCYCGQYTPMVSKEMQIGFRDVFEDRFKLGADFDLSFRPGLILSNTLLFGRFGLGLQHAQQVYSHTNVLDTCTSPNYDVTTKFDSYSTDYSIT